MRLHNYSEDQLVEKPAIDWRQKAQARAQVRLAIEDELDEGLPRAYLFTRIIRAEMLSGFRAYLRSLSASRGCLKEVRVGESAADAPNVTKSSVRHISIESVTPA
jgi:hypothetical protein